MDDWKLPWAGGCRCDAVRLKITAPPLLTAACHCSGCQRMSAGAFSLTIAIPSEGFAVTRGEPVIGGLHGAHRHYFCGYCKSWMFTRPAGMDDFVNMRATMLDDHGWFAPFIETWLDEALPWANTPAEFSFPKFPPVEDFPKYIAAFAERGARP